MPRGVLVRAVGAVLGVVALGVGVSACGADRGDGREDPDQIVEPTSLDGRTFRSTATTGHDLVPGSEVTLTFADGVLVVQAGCNSMRAAYSQQDDALRWTGPAAATLMACPEELMEQDQWLANRFTTGWTVADDGSADLVLESDGVSMSFEEVRGAASPSP